MTRTLNITLTVEDDEAPMSKITAAWNIEPKVGADDISACAVILQEWFGMLAGKMEPGGIPEPETNTIH